MKQGKNRKIFNAFRLIDYFFLYLIFIIWGYLAYFIVAYTDGLSAVFRIPILMTTAFLFPISIHLSRKIWLPILSKYKIIIPGIKILRTK